MIPYARQSVSPADIEAVVEVLRSDWLTQGPAIGRFEEGVRSRCGGKHAVAAHNATAALHLACLALELKPGDLLWTSPNTFVASANCARYCGADVDFVDIDAESFNMSIGALEDKLAQAAKRGHLPKIVMPVHFGGLPCDMPAIARLAQKYGFRVIEDASHAIGAELEGGLVGNGRYSDVTVFSFHPVKILTTGEGGMALTNDDATAARLRLLRTHGVTREASQMRHEADGPWYYEQIALGYNFRMTDIQAALGASQLSRLDEFLAQRRHLAQRYREALQGLPIRMQAERTGAKSSWHLFVINLDPARTRVTRRALYDAMRGRGVAVNVHYIPVHTQPYYRELGFQTGQFPAAERYYERCIGISNHLFPDPLGQRRSEKR